MKFTAYQLECLENACHSWHDQMSLVGRHFYMPIFPFMEEYCQIIATKAGRKRKNLDDNYRQACTWKLKQLEMYTIVLCNYWFSEPDLLQVRNMAMIFGQQLPVDMLQIIRTNPENYLPKKSSG